MGGGLKVELKPVEEVVAVATTMVAVDEQRDAGVAQGVGEVDTLV